MKQADQIKTARINIYDSYVDVEINFFDGSHYAIHDHDAVKDHYSGRSGYYEREGPGGELKLKDDPEDE